MIQKSVVKGSVEYYNNKVKLFSSQQALMASSIQKKADAAQQIVTLLGKPTLTNEEVTTLLTLYDLVG